LGNWITISVPSRARPYLARGIRAPSISVLALTWQRAHGQVAQNTLSVVIYVLFFITLTVFFLVCYQ